MLRTLLVLVALLLAPGVGWAHGKAHTGCEGNKRLLGSDECVEAIRLAETVDELELAAQQPGDVSIHIEAEFVATDANGAIVLKPNPSATSWTLTCHGARFTSTRTLSGINQETLRLDLSGLMATSPLKINGNCNVEGSPTTAQDIAVLINNPTGTDNGMIDLTGFVVDGQGSQQVGDLGIVFAPTGGGTSAIFRNTTLRLTGGEGLYVLGGVGSSGDSVEVNEMTCDTYYRCIKGAGGSIGMVLSASDILVEDGSGFRFSKMLSHIQGNNTGGYASDRGFLQVGDGGTHKTGGSIDWSWDGPIDNSGLPLIAMGDVNQGTYSITDTSCAYLVDREIIGSYEANNLSAIDLTYTGGADTLGVECRPTRPLKPGILTLVGNQNTIANNAVQGYGRLQFNSQLATYSKTGARLIDLETDGASLSISLPSAFPIAAITSTGFRINSPRIMKVQCYTNDGAPAAASIKLYHEDDTPFAGDPTIVCGTSEEDFLIYDHGVGGDTDFIDVNLPIAPLVSSFHATAPHATGTYQATGYQRGSGENTGLLHGDVIIFEVDGDALGNACSTCSDILSTGGGQVTGDLFGALPLGAIGAIPNGIMLRDKVTFAEEAETDGYGSVWRPLRTLTTPMQLWSESTGVNDLEVNLINPLDGTYDLRFKPGKLNDTYAQVTWEYQGTVNQNTGRIRWKMPTVATANITANFIDGGKFVEYSAPFGETMRRGELLQVELVTASGITNGVTVVVTMHEAGDEGAAWTEMIPSATLATQFAKLSFRTPDLGDTGVELLVPDTDFYQLVAFDAATAGGGMTASNVTDLITAPDNNARYGVLWEHTLSDNGGNPSPGDALEFVVLVNDAGQTPASPCASACGTIVAPASISLENNAVHVGRVGVGLLITTSADAELSFWVHNENVQSNLGFDTESLTFVVFKLP